MKKSAFILSLVVLLSSVLSVVSYAADETTANTTLIWINEEPKEPEVPSTPTPPPSTWEVVIPSTLTLDDGTGELWITSNYMNLQDGQFLIVTISPPIALINGTTYALELKNSNSDSAYVIPRLWNFESNTDSSITPNGVVARFDNTSTSPIHFGLITLSVYQQDILNAPSGTYTGTINFKIGIETYDDDF